MAWLVILAREEPMTSASVPISQVQLPNTCLHRLEALNVPGQTYEARVWLPPSYSDSPERRYPILYMPDGDHCFGMAVDIVRFLTRGTLAPEMIVAAIGYGSDRPPDEGGLDMRSRDLAPFATEFSPESGAEAFRLFLERELVPFVESTYRVDPELRAFYGFSLGALFGLYVMFKSPSLFRRHILVSPALMPSTAQIIDQAVAFAASGVSQPLGIYLCVGELEPFVPLLERLAHVLGNLNLRNFRLEWEVFPGGVHATAPAEALAKGVRLMLGGRSICEAMYEAYKRGGIASATGLYHDLLSRADPEYSFSEAELNGLGYVLLYRDKIDEAIEVFQLNVQAYPQAWNVYDSLGEAYMAAGDTALAKANYEKSVQLNPKNETGLAQLRKLEAVMKPPTLASA
jgi:predicted alpha/beta superfamily hydrolase